jgi:hypothetical protein
VRAAGPDGAKAGTALSAIEQAMVPERRPAGAWTDKRTAIAACLARAR